MYPPLYVYVSAIPYRTKIYFIYNIVCLCYIMFLKLLRVLLNVCSPKYHSLYMNYFLYNHATCPLIVSMMYMDTCFTTYYHSIKTMHPDSFKPQANSNIYTFRDKQPISILVFSKFCSVSK